VNLPVSFFFFFFRVHASTFCLPKTIFFPSVCGGVGRDFKGINYLNW